MATPNIDELAGRSLLLENAYAQQAWCSPSRASLLTSRRPDTTRVLDLRTYFRTSGGNLTTIPQHFKNNGYISIGIGKIFHYNVNASNKGDPPSWSGPFIKPKDEYYSRNISWMAVPQTQLDREPLIDTKVANEAIKALQNFTGKAKTGAEPFFIAAGFYKPHLPFIFPEQFLEKYPVGSIKLARNPFAPSNMPEIAWSSWEELPKFEDITELVNSINPPLGQINSTMPDFKTLELRRAYYASISHVDHEVGRVLKELESLELSENTVVVVWGDHGWQLGEHSEWCKHTNFEIAARTPVIIRIPGVTDNGVRSNALTELLDIFPTLFEAAGLAPLSKCPATSNNVHLCTEGLSMLPLIADPGSVSWKSEVFWQYPRGGWYEGTHIPKCMGYSLRNGQYRYTEWPKIKLLGAGGYLPDWEEEHCDHGELYDLKNDPQENSNLIFDPVFVETVKSLRKVLRNNHSR